MGGTAVAGRRLADLGAGRARRAPVTPLERWAAGHVREHAGEGSAPQAGRTPRQGSHTGLLVAGAGAALPKAIASWGSPRGRAGSVPGSPGTFPGGSWRREPSSPTACLLAFLIQTLKSELSLLYGPVGKRGFEPRPVRLRGSGCPSSCAAWAHPGTSFIWNMEPYSSPTKASSRALSTVPSILGPRSAGVHARRVADVPAGRGRGLQKGGGQAAGTGAGRLAAPPRT